LAEKEETKFKEKGPFMEIVFGPLWDQQSLFLAIGHFQLTEFSSKSLFY
jgi:hypothetical protein